MHSSLDTMLSTTYYSSKSNKGEVTTVRRLLAVPMCMLTIALLLTTGCGSDFWYEDDWLYDDVTYTSPWKNLDIYLNVADQDGDPVRGATVWVDGTLQEDKTGADYDALANSFPPGWRGWLYNSRSRSWSARQAIARSGPRYGSTVTIPTTFPCARPSSWNGQSTPMRRQRTLSSRRRRSPQHKSPISLPSTRASTLTATIRPISSSGPSKSTRR